MGRRSTLLSYRTALIVAAVLHVLLFLGLSLQWPSPTSLFPPTATPKIIEAVAVPSQSLQKEVERQQPQQPQEPLQQAQRVQEEAQALAQQQAAKVQAEQLQAQEQQAAEQRAQEQRKLEALKAEQQRLQTAQKQQALALEATRKQKLVEAQKIQEAQRLKTEQLAKQKAALLAQQKIKAAAALKVQQLAKQKAAEAAKQQALVLAQKKRELDKKMETLKKAQLLAKQQAIQKTLQQKLFDQQLAAEQQQISAAQAQAVDHIVNQYKAEILSAIGQRWIVPAGTNKNSAAQLFITLAPGGAVLNVVVVQSSGDPVLDRSAVTAVYKSSPLPVPKEAELFDHFRELHLTVRPEEIVSG